MGVPALCGIHPALHGAGLGRTGAPWYESSVHAGMMNERFNGLVETGAVGRVGIQVPHDHEALAIEAAGASRVVTDVTGASRRQVVGPEADLVVIAPAVAVLGAVESGRRRMADQQVH